MTSIKKVCSNLDTKTIDKIFAAAIKYNALQSRDIHPEGMIDNAGRFYLYNKCECCAGIRSPSRSHPWSQMVHGRTAIHVAHEIGLVDHERVVKYVAKLFGKNKHTEAYKLFMYDLVYRGKAFTSDLGV